MEEELIYLLFPGSSELYNSCLNVILNVKTLQNPAPSEFKIGSLSPMSGINIQQANNYNHSRLQHFIIGCIVFTMQNNLLYQIIGRPINLHRTYKQPSLCQSIFRSARLILSGYVGCTWMEMQVYIVYIAYLYVWN